MKEMGQKEFSEKLELAKGLEESILRFSDERNQENLNKIFASIEELINNGGGLLLAADPAGEKDGQQQINLKFLKTEEGKSYAAAFTNVEEQKAGNEGQQSSAVLLPVAELLQIAANHPHSDGVVINPFSNSFILLKEAIVALQNKMRTQNVEERLKGSAGIFQAVAAYHEEQKKLPEGEAMPEDKKRAGIERVLQGFLQAMELNAQLLVAIVSTEKKEGEIADGQVLLNHLTTQDGRDAIAVFTSGEQIEKNPAETAAIAMPVQDVLKAAIHISESGKMDGLIINPWSQSFFLSLDMVKWLLDAKMRGEERAKENEEKRAMTQGLSETMLYSALIGGSLGIAKEKDALGEAPYGEQAFSYRPAMGSVLLAEFHSLNTERKLSFPDMQEKFYDWKSKGMYALEGQEQDAVETMDASIMRFATGKGPKDSGVDAEDDSFLSRMLPFAMMLCRRLHQFSDMDRAMLHDAVRLTNNNPKAMLMGELYATMLRNLVLHLGGESLEEQLQAAANYVALFYEEEEAENEEEKRLNEEAKEQHREDVKDYDALVASFDILKPFLDLKSLEGKKAEELSGKESCEDTLLLATWVLLNSKSYQEAVELSLSVQGSKNLAVVVSTLAAAYYGLSQIPKDWVNALAGKEEVREIAIEWQMRWLD